MGSLFKAPKAPAPTTVVTPVTPMPDPELGKSDAKKKAVAASQKSGRVSTMLSDTSDSLGA